MSRSLPTFGSAIRENENLRKQNNVLNTKLIAAQKHIDALLRQNTFLKEQLQPINKNLQKKIVEGKK